jgi:hypothetical protein
MTPLPVHTEELADDRPKHGLGRATSVPSLTIFTPKRDMGFTCPRTHASEPITCARVVVSSRAAPAGTETELAGDKTRCMGDNSVMDRIPKLFSLADENQATHRCKPHCYFHD